MKQAILLVQCPDAPGIVRHLSEWIYQHQGNIIDSHQHSTDPDGGQFFMRLAFCFADNISFAELRASFAAVSHTLNAQWALHDRAYRPKLSVLVSQYDHCLFELLYRWKSGELKADITAILSNHQSCAELAKRYEIPFHYCPVSLNTKSQQEQRILNSVKDNSDFLVLARYMQILSSDFLNDYGCDIINIHHSFLPSFAGANPYKQAYARGVKLIGATAHYVTSVLDEGPIIAQMVEAVSHRDDVTTLKRKGKNLEKLTLMRAIEAHVEHRVIRFSNKTIVFS